MTIKTPWSIRLRPSSSGSAHAGNWWNRKRDHDAETAPHYASAVQEEDLDHLGDVHKTSVHHHR